MKSVKKRSVKNKGLYFKTLVHKVKWMNLLKLIAFVISAYLLMRDSYYLIIKGYSFTWLGVWTYALNTFVFAYLFDFLCSAFK